MSATDRMTTPRTASGKAHLAKHLEAIIYPPDREDAATEIAAIEAEAAAEWREALKALTFGMAYTDEYGDTHWPVGFESLDRARALLASEGSDEECTCEGEFIWACGPECDCWHHEHDFSEAPRSKYYERAKKGLIIDASEGSDER